jgi:hypothetical protein
MFWDWKWEFLEKFNTFNISLYVLKNILVECGYDELRLVLMGRKPFLNLHGIYMTDTNKNFISKKLVLSLYLFIYLFLSDSI